MTLRQLVWMVEGKREDEGHQVGWIVAHVVNAMAGKVLCQVRDVNPYPTKTRRAEQRFDRVTDDITVLDSMFF